MKTINFLVNKSEIPKFLKEARHKLGYTQEQMADEIGIKRWSIADYETGRLRTPLDVYLKIQERLYPKAPNHKGNQAEDYCQ